MKRATPYVRTLEAEFLHAKHRIRILEHACREALIAATEPFRGDMEREAERVRNVLRDALGEATT